MKLRFRAATALAACAMLAVASRVPAKQTANAHSLAPTPANSAGMDSDAGSDMASQLDAMADSDLGGYGSCNTCDTGCNSCSGGGLGGFLDRPIQLVFGAEYIYARANFSDALSFIELDPGGGETWHCFEFNYDPSYSFYGGVYLPDCGGSVIFDYTRLTSDADHVSERETQGRQIFGPFEIDDFIEGDASAELNSYDLSFAKTIPLGCPLECGCGKACGDCCDDTCCDGSCGCGWCPAWDITWSGGIRFADASWTRGLVGLNNLNNFQPFESYQTTMNFDGFGGRVGLMGRRYIGRRGLVSLYAKGDWSILMGDVEIVTQVRNLDLGTVATHSKDCEQIIPVTEIELGGSAHLGSHATLSGGYFWSAWHDLGMSETYNSPNFQISHYDDANIMGWDGLFARVEVAF